MNIIGEYSIQYNIYTMFNVYSLKITNHNLITNNGYKFFMQKWFKEDDKYPIVFGYYNDNRFYRKYNIDGTFSDDMSVERNYDKTSNYIDKKTYKQYRFDGENFVSFTEKLDKICLGKCYYTNENTSKPLSTDTELYLPTKEIPIDNFDPLVSKLVMECEINNEDINGTTEIGVKTNHGRLVSHDIHPPYNLPFGSNVTLKYEFKLQ